MKRKKSELFKNNKEIYTYNNERFMKFKERNADNIVEIPLENIKLLYQIHIDGLARCNLSGKINYYKNHNKLVTGSIIVHKDMAEEGIFNLVSGWGNYVIANALNQDTIKAIIVKGDRKAFKKRIKCVSGYEKVTTDSLRVPDFFARTKVNDEKLKEIHEYQISHHQPLKPIVINKNNLIVDGYAQYIYNVNMEIETCQVHRVRK